MHFDIHFIIMVMILGFVTGYVDGIAGGGGLLTIPVLLSLGLSPLVTLGTSKFAGVLGCFQSLRVFIKRNIINVKLWYPVIFGAVSGSMLGALTIQFINPNFLNRLIPIFMLIVIIYMCIPKNASHYYRKDNLKPKKRSSILFSSIIGFYDGFFGPGTAAVGTSIMMFGYKIELLQATAVVRLVLFSSNIAAFLMFTIKGNVDFSVGIALASTYMIGSYFGSVSAVRFGAKFIKPIFLVMSAIICIHLLL